MKMHLLRPLVIACTLLLVPLIMSFLDRGKPIGDGWHWGAMDFVVMSGLLFGAGIGYEFIARKLGSKTQRAVLGIAIVCLVLAVWVELAVDGISQLVSLIAR
jgi:hypothetical protein